MGGGSGGWKRKCELKIEKWEQREWERIRRGREGGIVTESMKRQGLEVNCSRKLGVF